VNKLLTVFIENGIANLV